jgi:hypothetical protein
MIAGAAIKAADPVKKRLRSIIPFKSRLVPDHKPQASLRRPQRLPR